MNPRLIDPNNHVPEVSPDDGWGDVDEAHAEATFIGTTLPPRRKSVERASAEPTQDQHPGLRIDVAAPRRVDSDEAAPRIEVQELSGSVVRLEATGPVPQKVPRQTVFQERPAATDRLKDPTRTGHAWGKSPSRTSIRWVIAAGIGIFVVIVGGLVLLPMINAPNAVRAPAPVVQTILKPPLEDSAALLFLLQKQPEAIAIYRKFASAQQVEEVIPLVREAAETEPALRKSWKPMGVASAWEPTAPDWTMRNLGDREYAILSGTLPDQSYFRAIFLQEGDRIVLDWKATTGFSTATFAELADGTGDPSEIRGDLAAAPYFNAVFPEEKFRSWRLLSPDDSRTIWCYTRVDSPADEAIAPLLEKGIITGELALSRKVTVRLEKGPDGAQPNQWLIAELLHEEWVKP